MMIIDHEAREKLREVRDGLAHNASHTPKRAICREQFDHFARQILALLDASDPWSKNPTFQTRNSGQRFYLPVKE